MGICPFCNGMEDLKVSCQKCGNMLEDSGREMDFYDDYSAYMPIDLMKLENGYPSDESDGLCPHLLKCPQCGYDEIRFIKE